MKLKSEIELSLHAVQKISGSEIVFDKKITEAYEEGSEQFNELCEEYENILGYERNVDRDKFDKEMLFEINEGLKQVAIESIEKIQGVIKEVYLHGKKAFVEFGGYIINVEDFSAFRFDEIKTRVTKQ